MRKTKRNQDVMTSISHIQIVTTVCPFETCLLLTDDDLVPRSARVLRLLQAEHKMSCTSHMFVTELYQGTRVGDGKCSLSF